MMQEISKELLTILENWIEKYELLHNNFIFFPFQLCRRATTDIEQEEIKILIQGSKDTQSILARYLINTLTKTSVHMICLTELLFML